ncbi:MAG: hypothetical protein ACI8ZN_002318, partial [Bacteroidia bacterium]
MCLRQMPDYTLFRIQWLIQFGAVKLEKKTILSKF